MRQIGFSSVCPAPFGKIIHTCHMLIFTVGAEEKSYIVYRRTDGSDDDTRPDPMDYLDPWFE